MSGIEAVDPDINVNNVRKEKLYGYANTSLVPRRSRGGGGGGEPFPPPCEGLGTLIHYQFLELIPQNDHIIYTWLSHDYRDVNPY